MRCLSLAAVHRMPKYGIQVPAALKHLRFVCGRSYRSEVERQDGEEMVAEEMVKSCVSYAADHIEVRSGDRIVKKWLLTLKSCVSYAADHTEVRSSGMMGKKWLLTLKSCVSYAADHTEMRSGDRIVKKWLLSLKSCVSYAADRIEMRSSDRMVKRWLSSAFYIRQIM